MIVGFVKEAEKTIALCVLMEIQKWENVHFVMEKEKLSAPFVMVLEWKYKINNY